MCSYWRWRRALTSFLHTFISFTITHLVLFSTKDSSLCRSACDLPYMSFHLVNVVDAHVFKWSSQHFIQTCYGDVARMKGFTKTAGTEMDFNRTCIPLNWWKRKEMRYDEMSSPCNAFDMMMMHLASKPNTLSVYWVLDELVRQRHRCLV